MFNKRRDLLRNALLGSLACALPWGSASAQTARSGLSVQRLAKDLVLITGAGCNVLAAADDSGVVMVDGGLERQAGELLQVLEQTFGQRPVRALFNTHWHPEQCGANAMLAQRGSRILAHANTRLWLGTEIQRPWEDTVYAPLPDAARPGEIFYERGQDVSLGDGRVEYGYMLQAHTDGDCYVFFPQANVLAAGGVIRGDDWPLIDWWTGGWVGGLVEGVETLLQVANKDTRIVPAQGPALSYAELEQQADMYRELFVRLRDLLFKGLSPAEAVAARPTADFQQNWSSPDPFVTLAFQSLWGYYAPDV